MVGPRRGPWHALPICGLVSLCPCLVGESVLGTSARHRHTWLFLGRNIGCANLACIVCQSSAAFATPHILHVVFGPWAPLRGGDAACLRRLRRAHPGDGGRLSSAPHACCSHRLKRKRLASACAYAILTPGHRRWGTLVDLSLAWRAQWRRLVSTSACTGPHLGFLSGLMLRRLAPSDPPPTGAKKCRGGPTFRPMAYAGVVVSFAPMGGIILMCSLRRCSPAGVVADRGDDTAALLRCLAGATCAVLAVRVQVFVHPFGLRVWAASAWPNMILDAGVVLFLWC